uniref:Uncharacterized protein n=1 Tax=Ascaris lumbricoides TaxID=6252 RepID=A0A0M3IJ11_ASCLU
MAQTEANSTTSKAEKRVRKLLKICLSCPIQTVLRNTYKPSEVSWSSLKSCMKEKDAKTSVPMLSYTRQYILAPNRLPCRCFYEAPYHCNLGTMNKQKFSETLFIIPFAKLSQFHQTSTTDEQITCQLRQLNCSLKSQALQNRNTTTAGHKNSRK